MKNWSVRAKLTLAFGSICMVVLLTAVVTVVTLKQANDQFEHYINGIGMRLNTAHLLREAIDARAIAARNLVLVTSHEDIAVEKANVTNAHNDVNRHLHKLTELVQADPTMTQKARDLIGGIVKIEQSYSAVALAIVELAVNGKKEEAIGRINTDCRPLLTALTKASLEYADYTVKRSADLVDDANDSYAIQRTTLIGISVCSLLLSIAAGMLITRNLQSSLGADPMVLCDVVDRVAKGNLTERFLLRVGDTSSVLAAIGKMQVALGAVVTSVRQGSESVASASTQIAQGNHDLSARTEQQATALQETTASMEQLGGTVVQNAQSAEQANQLARSASLVAVRGGEVVERVVQTMKGINESSQKIGDIISVIDGIAFQTNILALNAAVEAARAGEQGRGFAVVAAEVRSLAGRSAEAAKEIKQLINASVERVEQGAALVDQAGATMAEVVNSIQRVTDIMGEINIASTAQATGVRQVGEAVAQMDQSTQQNAALVEQMAAAASSLKGQAGELVQAVSIFQLDGDSSNTRGKKRPLALT